MKASQTLPGNDAMFAYRVSDAHELRLLQLTDTEELFALVDANRAYLRRWLPWLDDNLTSTDTRKFIESTLQQLSENRGLIAAIQWQGKIAGVIGYNHIDWQNRTGTIGYWLAAAFQGQGLMSASCRALVEYGFQMLNLNRIVICCATENYRSCAIPERLGFVHEGTLREGEWLYDHFVDLKVYGCLRRDWVS